MRTKPLIAPALLMLWGASLLGCSRDYAAQPPAQVCASKESLGRIKRAAFDQAVAEASSQNRYAFERLDEQAHVRLVDPVVESYDRDTKKTSCTATLQVWLPPGVRSRRELRSPIHYVSQPTANGHDVVFSPSGLEELASGIAGADLSAWAAAEAPRKPGLVVEVVPQTELASRNATSGRTPKPAGELVEREVSRRSLTVAAQSAAPAAPPMVPRAPRPEPVRAAAPAFSLSSTPAVERASPPVVEGGFARQTERPVRVFVHIAGPSQMGAADRIRAELSRISIAEQPVGTPPVRYVARLPSRNEVRCLKRADCPAARRIAGYLANDLGAPVAVVDMSDTYQNDPGVRAGSLELWLRSQEQGPAT